MLLENSLTEADMNDGLTGTLTTGWRIPAYARDMLWLETMLECVQTQGEYGAFALSQPSELVTLRWGGAEGSVLARLSWRADSLEWDGRVGVGGYVDTLHMTAIDTDDGEIGLVVLTIGGMPLQPGVMPFPDAGQRRVVPYPFPSFRERLCEDIEETITTWIALEDSPALTLAQDALVSKLRVYVFGQLADDDSTWDRALALPLMLESMTIFAP
jgi:hypothetical protein